MSRLSKKEQEKLMRQTKKLANRGNTWVGIRPVIMNEGKYNRKVSRQESRKIIRDFLGEMEESV